MPILIILFLSRSIRLLPFALLRNRCLPRASVPLRNRCPLRAFGPLPGTGLRPGRTQSGSKSPPGPIKTAVPSADGQPGTSVKNP